MACGMCHIERQAFTSNQLATSVGMEGKSLRRNAPSLFNVAYETKLFRDGRENSLETQAWSPIVSPDEMAAPSVGWELAKVRSLPDYPALFERSYPGRGVSMETIGIAIAAYERTLLLANSPFDRWRYGGEKGALSQRERLDFLAWVASTTSTTTRDGAQTKLLGDIRQQDGLGTGLIPLDNILGRPTMARGISDFVDSVTLRRESGGRAAIRFKTFEMDRKAFQGEACDEVWLDEDPGDDVVYGECLARIVATRGQIIFTSTPTLGVTPVRKRFKERLPGTAEILMTIDDATHIPAEERQRIVSRYKASERATRAYGADMQGEGAVFEIPVESITHSRDPATFPPYWPWLWAVDFSHGGMSSSAHAFAAVLGCWDRDADVIYIVHAIRMRQALPIQHVAAIKAHPCWDARVAWPHDGGISGFESAETFAGTYKRHGQARGFFAECEDERVVDFNADRDRGRGGRSMFELDGRHARNVLRLWCFTFWVNFANEDRTKRCMAGAAHSCHELARGYSTPLVTLFFFPWCSVSSGGAVKSSNLSLGFASGLFVDRRQFAWRESQVILLCHRMMRILHAHVVRWPWRDLSPELWRGAFLLVRWIDRAAASSVAAPEQAGHRMTERQLPQRRFPPPWQAEETDACFIVRDAKGQALAYVYFEDEPGRRAAAHLLTRD